MKMMKKNTTLMVLDDNLCSGLHGVYVSAQVNFFEKLNLTSSFLPSSNYFVDFNLSIQLHLFKW